MIIENHAVDLTKEVLASDFRCQLMMGVVLLNFQSSYVLNFDLTYNEGLLPFYRGMINELLNILILQRKIEYSLDVIEAHIPDTEVFSANYGTFAKIAMISGWHLISFCKNRKNECLLRAIDGFFENKDMENQISQHPLDDKILFQKLTLDLTSVLRRIKSAEYYDFISANEVVSSITDELNSKA